MALVVGVEPVIAGIIEAAHGQGGAKRITFAGMVQHHIQQYFNACRLQSRYRRADFRPAAGSKARIRRTESDGVVTPDVGQAERGQMALVNPRHGRQQFQRGNAKAQKMVDNDLAAKPRKRAAPLP